MVKRPGKGPCSVCPAGSTHTVRRPVTPGTDRGGLRAAGRTQGPEGQGEELGCYLTTGDRSAPGGPSGSRRQVQRLSQAGVEAGGHWGPLGVTGGSLGVTGGSLGVTGGHWGWAVTTPLTGACQLGPGPGPPGHTQPRARAQNQPEVPCSTGPVSGPSLPPASHPPVPGGSPSPEGTDRGERGSCCVEVGRSVRRSRGASERLRVAGRGRATVYSCRSGSLPAAARRPSSRHRRRGRLPGARCHTPPHRGQQPDPEGTRPAPPPRGASGGGTGDRGRDRRRELPPSTSLLSPTIPCQPAGVGPTAPRHEDAEQRNARREEQLLRAGGRGPDPPPAP